MGVFDSIADAAKQHEAKIEEGIEKVGDLIDEKTGGKFADQVDKVQNLANEGLDKLTGDDFLRWRTLAVAVLAISVELGLRWLGHHPPAGDRQPAQEPRADPQCLRFGGLQAGPGIRTRNGVPGRLPLQAAHAPFRR